MAANARAASAVAATLLAALLGACASVPAPPARSAAPAPGGAVVAPNANLVVQGIPPIPAGLAQAVARYTDFRGHRFVDWHPERAEMLVAHRAEGHDTTQIFRIAGPQSVPEALTDVADPVRVASYEPNHGEYIVFERGSSGNEASQLYRLDLATRRTTLLSDVDERNEFQAWLHRSGRLLYLSLPLDRTAAGRTRSEIQQTLSLVDPLEPSSRRRIAELPGGGWRVGGVSWDDGQVAMTRYVSAAESEVWLLDLASGARRRVLPAAGEPAATHFAMAWAHDDSGLFFLSDRSSEFRELMFLRLADGRIARLSRHIPWDVEDVAVDASGRLLAARVNVDGKGELRLFDAEHFDELPTPDLPEGSVQTIAFHRHRPALAFTLSDSRTPATVAAIDPARPVTQAWTTPGAPPAIDLQSFGSQRIVHWPSFDGRRISGILSMPPARFTGPRPVLVSIHGGPEGQARVGFLGRDNYFLEELGVAVLRPNVRGSSGFGKTFLALDNGLKREDSVRDIGALLDWIARQPEFDASRVLVEGGSYGGYMSLAVATHYADRIAGAIDVVGISNFVTFLEHTESYRRDLRRVEYGDERDPAMREFLLRISPLTSAERIAKPLFVVQGRNDPRVPSAESEQIVARVRANGTPVWYLRADNEGHGFARKENADFEFFAMVMFMRATLLR